MTYSEVRKIKYAAERVRCIETLYSIINEIENEHFEDEDFETTKNELLKDLYNIKISKLKENSMWDDFEDKLYEVLGNNYILFIPPKSDLVIKLERLYQKRKEELK